MSIAQLSRTIQEPPSHLATPNDAKQARISFRQPVSSTGFIDAAWWPHTLDLNIEVPSLLDVLWTAGREINRVTYNLTAWDPAPRRMHIDGRTIRLGGFTTSDPLTVRLSDAWGQERIDILVIAPDTEPAVADRALAIASRAGGNARAADILAEAISYAVDPQAAG